MSDIKLLSNFHRLANALIVLFLMFVSVSSYSQPSLRMYITTQEGANISPRTIANLISYLNQTHCYIDNVIASNGPLFLNNEALFFSAIETKTPTGYQKLLSVKVINNEELSSSVLVRASTGVNELKSLDDIHLAVMSDKSILGNVLALKLLVDAGVNISKEKTIVTDNNLASVSLLMHKDVFAAAIATPLANKWAEANSLHIIAQSEKVIPGGIWAHQDIDRDMLKACRKAFSSIRRDTRIGNKQLALFPAWVDSFSIVIN